MACFDCETHHLQKLRRHLAECTVLLRHSGGFPLSAPGPIAAYGSGVRHTVKGGTGSGEVNSRSFINIEQGLQRAGFTVTTANWLDRYDQMYAKARKQFLKDLQAQARRHHTLAILEGMGKVMPEPDYDLPLDGAGDTAIYVLARISGEGNDRDPVPGDILLTDTEIRDILALQKQYKAFLLVLNVGGPVDLSPLSPVENILILSQLGAETGDVLADILLGRATPSGKLTTTWADWPDYASMADFGDWDDTRYREGIYVGYRYFDSLGMKARYPFGYGLSYTTFSIDRPEVTLQGSQVTVRTVIHNIGNHSGKEVLQVYLSCPAGKLDKPWQDLAAFAKTPELAPGDQAEITAAFDLRDLASYDEETARYLLERGNYIVRVGNSSVNTSPAALICLDSDRIVTQARPCCGSPDFTDWKPDTPIVGAIPTDIPILPLTPDAIQPHTVTYDLPEPIEPLVKTLSDRQLAYLNVGGFDPKGGFMTVIGNASRQVAGAAGETTSMVPAIPSLITADGPAGVRVSPRFYRDSRGAHTVGQTAALPETMTELLPPVLQYGMKLLSGSGKPPRNAEIQTQYATALPIGTALAQSWNIDFANLCGQIVGDEMARFGVHLWLAPALNIHRSIRCGRNFEYYSEDPMLSGLVAAAITAGVQSHPGCGVTLKHYAANNQETNRYGSNSLVSQRALREIYLKGFGLCIREAHPTAVMTSYNLLNGVHTAESRELCQDILRSEFGFDGILMTDWIVAIMTNNKRNIHPAVQPDRIAAAGGDLIMPGCPADFKALLTGLKTGALTRQQLEINASRLCRTARELTKTE